MKRCPVCEQKWDDENIICPVDSNVLEPVPEAAGDGAAQPENESIAEAEAGIAKQPPPRSVDTAELLSSALDALEGKRSHDREILLERMHHLELYNTYCHATWQFVHELTSKSSRFGVSIRNLNEEVRMWVTYTLSVGEGKNLRTFPIRVVYDRELGHDVRIEIDLEAIGQSRDEQINRTEEVGGRPTNTRFGYSFLIAMPREIVDEKGTVEWLRAIFYKIFQAAYSIGR